MNFGGAVEMMKAGRKVARSGWNGKGMWLMLVQNYQVGFDPSVLGRKLLPWIGMKTADDSFVPWLASQTDVLAEDWEIVFYLTTNPANRGKPDMIYAEKPEIAA